MLRINYINITDAWTSCRITLLFSPNVVVLWHKRIECWVIAVQIMQKDKYSVCFESHLMYLFTTLAQKEFAEHKSILSIAVTVFCEAHS